MDANWLKVPALLVWLFCQSSCVPQTKADYENSFRPAPFHFGAYRDEIPDLEGPLDVAFDKEGRLFILLNEAAQIAVFDTNGKPLFRFSGPGSGREDLRDPQGFFLSPKEIFVADSGNHRIQVFDHQGRWRRSWGLHGKKPGQFSRPNAILGFGDRVYVSDYGNHRVQVFDRQGRFQQIVNGGSHVETRLRWPVDLSVDPLGRLLVADEGRHQIVVFDNKGQWLDVWGDWGTHPGFFDEPRSMLWRGEELLVLDRRNHRVQRFNNVGEWQESWGWEEWIPHQGAGTLHYPDAFAIDSSGGMAVVCEQAERRCQRFDGADQTVSDPRPPIQSRSHFGAYIAMVGSLLLVPDPENHYVFTFDMRSELPVELTRFGERGTGFGLLQKPLGLTSLGGNHSMVLCDPLGARLQEFRLDFDPNAKVRFRPNMTRFTKALDYTALTPTSYPNHRPKPIWPLELHSIERHRDGRFFAIDRRNSLIWVFSSDWQYLDHWGGEGEQPGQFRMPTDLAFSKDGQTLYISDSLNGRIQALDDRGHVRTLWHQTTPGQSFIRPFGLAAGWDGQVYVTDRVTHRIHVFNEEGDYQTSIAEHGSKIAQLWHPADIDHDHQGRLLVVDQGNHRLQVFDAAGRWQLTFGAGRAFTPRNLPASRRHPGILEE